MKENQNEIFIQSIHFDLTSNASAKFYQNPTHSNWNDVACKSRTYTEIKGEKTHSQTETIKKTPKLLKGKMVIYSDCYDMMKNFYLIFSLRRLSPRRLWESVEVVNRCCTLILCLQKSWDSPGGISLRLTDFSASTATLVFFLFLCFTRSNLLVRKYIFFVEPHMLICWLTFLC